MQKSVFGVKVILQQWLSLQSYFMTTSALVFLTFLAPSLHGWVGVLVRFSPGQRSRKSINIPQTWQMLSCPRELVSEKWMSS